MDLFSSRGLARACLLIMVTWALFVGTIPLSAAAAPAPAPEQESLTAPLKAPIAAVSLAVPAEVMIGETFTFTATFANTSGTATDVGYGPFIDIVFPVNGADGNGNQNPPLDGISFISATYLGSSVTSTVLTFPGSGAANTCVNHPYAVAPTTGAALQVCGRSGDVLVVLQLPFGSFVPGQPPVTIDITASLSNLADVGTALNLRARGGYQYGATPLNDWCCVPVDATILSHPATNSTTWPASPTTPSLFTVTKSYSGPEGETATGPNFPRQYVVTVDIAAGQTLTDLDLTDTLPDNMQFVSFIGSTPASSAVSTPGTATPGGTLTRRFASVTGTTSTADATMTFSFYIPRLDLGGGAVIDAGTGAPATSVNEAQATATWTPIDPRDITSPVTGICVSPCHTLTDRSLATQKSVSLFTDTAPLDNPATPVVEYSPGDTLEYALEFQVSDFLAFNNVTLTDILSDGQHLDLSFPPTLAVDGNGYTLSTAALNAANYDEIRHWTGGPAVPPVNGTTELVFRVSAEVITRGEPNGRLIGGCIDPVNGSNPPDCTVNDGPTSGLIVFHAVIQQNFTDVFPSGDPSVDHGDVLADSLTITGDVLNPTTSAFAPTGSSVTDGSSADLMIGFGSLTKGVYAINGVVCDPCTAQLNNGINPGDTVTYRLGYTQPASDFEETVITDFLPLPVFVATEVATLNNAICGVPAAGNACLGPSDTFHALTTPVPPAPTLSTNATSNTVAFTYADYDNTSDVTSLIDLLFTVTVSNDPFADGLFLTNQAHATEGTTNATPTAQDAIIQIKLNEPALYTTKAAVSTDNPSGVFVPTIAAPISFNVPGTAGVSWSGGTLNSTYLDANPINSDLGQVDAGDLVRFAIVIRNDGRSQKGAFDISIRDTFQPGYVIPGGLGLNLQVYRGDGLALTYTDLGGGLFGTGIKIDDPGAPGVGACQAHDATNGRNVIVITYDLQLDNAITPDQGIINTASLFNYSGTSGGPDFTNPQDLIDTATVLPITFSVKSITTTSEAHTSEAGTGTTGNPRLAAIGEVVRFRIVAGIPEGTVTNVRVHDVLPPGLIFLNDDNARMAFVSDGGGGVISSTLGAGLDATGDETTVTGITPAFLLPDTALSETDSTSTANYAADNVDAYASGDDIFIKLGHVNNTDRDNDSEFVVVEFNAILANIAGNTAGVNRDNRASVRNGSSTADSAPSSNVRVRVVEPAITFGKTIVSLPSPLDAGGVVQYRLSFANGTGTNVTTAFETRLTDPLPAQLSLNLASITVTLAGGAAGVTNTSVANNVDVTVDSVPAGGSVTVDYTATILDTVTPAEIINNTSTSIWTGLPGAGTSPNGTGSIAGAEGGTTGERNETGGVNNYTRTSSQNFTIDATSVSITKQLTATSAAHTAGSDVAIGEEITYDILLTFPEGTTSSDTVVDDLSIGLELVTGTPQVLTTAAASGGVLTADFNGTIGAQNIVEAPGDGGSVTFAISNIVVPGDNIATNNTILMRFRARVTNIAVNLAGTVISNVATNQVGAGAPVSSNVVNATVVEPGITLGKTIVSLPTPLDAGGVVQYRITYANATGATVSTALDVNITDALASALLLNSTGAPDLVITSTAGVGAITNNSTTSNIDITIASVPPGESVTVDFFPVIQNTITPNQIVDNIGNSTWTSLAGSLTEERTGADGPTGSPNNYAATSNQSFTGALPYTITKQLTATSAPHTAGSDVAIGEEITYDILLTFPEGTTPSDTVVDDLPTGLEVVAGTPEVITTAAASGGVLAADFSGTIGSQNISVVAGDGGSVTFAFTNVIVNGDNVSTNNALLMRFRARIMNIAANLAGTTISNEATNQVGVDAPTTSNAVTATVVEPSITFGKTILSLPTPLDAGGIVQYQITYVNGTGATVSTALDVRITDLMPVQLSLNLPVTVTLAGGSAGVTDNSAGNNLDVTIASVPAGGSVTVDYSATIQASVSPGDVINNTGNSTWTSLSGVVTGERTGADGPTGSPNNYAATSSQTIGAALPSTIAKQLTLTSASHTGGSDVAIGEQITYDILLAFPEGTTPADTVVDDLPVGLEVVAGTPQIITTAAASGGALAANFNGTLGAQNITVVPGEGGSVTFDLANVVVQGDNDATNNTILLRFRALVLNVNGNQNAGTLDNVATNQVGAGAPTTSNMVSVNVVEPVLNLTKQISDGTPGVGQVLTFTLTLAHDAASTADAFDVVLTDDLPVELTLDLTSINVTTGGTGAVTNLQENSSGNHVEVTADSLELGATIQVTYEATVVGAYGSSFQNSAVAEWTSLPGTTPASGTTSGERTGSGTPSQNDHRSTDQVTISVTRNLAKNLVTSNVTSTSPDHIVTIGEILTYQVVLTIPGGSTDLAIITDTLDNGLAFVDCAETAPVGTNQMHDIIAGPDITSSNFTFAPDANGNNAANCSHGTDALTNNPYISSSGGTLRLDLGTISNTGAAAETITLTYRVIVLDIGANVQNVTLDNDVDWTWTGGTMSTRAAPSLRIIEPDLQINKTVDPATAALGSVVTYSIEIEHTNDSLTTAYDVVVTDGIPTGLVLDESSVTVNGSAGLPAAVITTSPTQFSVYWSQFPLGETATITFEAVFAGPSPVFNTANVEWSSLQIDPAPRLQPQSAYNTFSTERRYDPLSQTVNDYRVSATVRLRVPQKLPKTGFAPGRMTLLPQQPGDFSYTALGDFWLEIPSLNVRVDIVGVPFRDENWNLTWLGAQAGYMEGTAYPTHAGNTGITAHAYLADGSPGPFASLDKLHYGDQVVVHMGGQRYIYEVRQNELVRPNDLSVIKHEEYSWLTLLTCKTYSETLSDYVYRVSVRAVLVKVEADR